MTPNPSNPENVRVPGVMKTAMWVSAGLVVSSIAADALAPQCIPLIASQPITLLFRPIASIIALASPLYGLANVLKRAPHLTVPESQQGRAVWDYLWSTGLVANGAPAVAVGILGFII